MILFVLLYKLQWLFIDVWGFVTFLQTCASKLNSFTSTVDLFYHIGRVGQSSIKATEILGKLAILEVRKLASKRKNTNNIVTKSYLGMFLLNNWTSPLCKRASQNIFKQAFYVKKHTIISPAALI